MKRKFKPGNMVVFRAKYPSTESMYYFVGCAKVTDVWKNLDGRAVYSLESVSGLHRFTIGYYSYELDEAPKDKCNICEVRFKCWTS